jgi:hypothetical protein
MSGTSERKHGQPTMIAGLHPEDIKASIRKKYKTLNAFERAHDLPFNSVSNWLRGNISKPVKTAVEAHLRSLLLAIPESNNSVSSKRKPRTHRLNERAA